MKRLVEFPLNDGTMILVEVDVPEEEGGIARAGRVDDVLERAQVTLEAALTQIRPAAEAVITEMRSLSESPHEVSIKFGLKLSTEFGAVLAAARAEAHYEITLMWKQETE